MTSDVKDTVAEGIAETEESLNVTGACVGDLVFFNHPQGPMSGEVTAVGKHGAHIRTGKTTHKMYWKHVLGLKKRASQNYNIVEYGEDGHLVEDANGLRRFVMVPNEAREDPMVAKALGKGGKVAGRPGLTQKEITDKTGRHQKKWVRTNKDQPKERAKAAPDDAPAGKRPNPGDKVTFTAGDFKGEGTVSGQGGNDGTYVTDKSGRKHAVKWAEIHSEKNPGKPTYESRQENESDKDYAKRAVDTQKSPEHLPEEHDKYFHTEGSTKVGMDKLHSSKTDEEKGASGDNGAKRMSAAYHGALSKRAPITVAKHPTEEGHYNILDGNGTHAAAMKHGWKELPVNVIDEYEHRAATLAKAAVDPAKFASLPKKQFQPIAPTDQAKLFETLAPAALEELKDWLDKGKGIASQHGFVTMTKAPGDVTHEEYDKPGGMLFIAPLKSAERSAEKVASDYDGDWSKLTDVVRCTVAADDLHGIADMIKALEGQGMKVAQQPKNKFLTPSDQHYRDINFVVEMANGCLAEVQCNVKDMLKAKNEGHEFYEVSRKILGKYTQKGVIADRETWTPEDQKAFDESEQKQIELYDKAWIEHIRKHYSSDSKMIKSFSRILLFKKRS